MNILANMCDAKVNTWDPTSQLRIKLLPVFCFPGFSS